MTGTVPTFENVNEGVTDVDENPFLFFVFHLYNAGFLREFMD